MAASILMQEMKKHTILMTLATNHNLKTARSFMLKIRNKLVISRGDLSSVAKKNKEKIFLNGQMSQVYPASSAYQHP